MKELSIFGKELDRLLKDLKVTKTELGIRMGVSPSSVTQYFEGSPSVDTLLRISKALGVPAWQMMASIETGAPVRMFMIMEEITKLPVGKQNIILEGMKPLIALALGKTLEKK